MKKDNQDLPQRKHPRLKEYDYSQQGAYFITICTQDRRCLLSHIVGRGLAPAETAEVKYTVFGRIAEQQLLLLEQRYSHLKIDKYVIMPDHIHAILILKETAGARGPRNELVSFGVRSPRPTLTDIVCAYKSLTTRECIRNGFSGKLFQTSFYEHIIRDDRDYDEVTKYISENPMRRQNDYN